MESQHGRAVQRAKSWKRKSNIFAAKTGNSKINSSVEKAKNIRPWIARTIWRARRGTALVHAAERGASGRIGPVRSGGITATCRVEELRELPEEQRACPKCGQALTPSDAEESELIEIEVRAYRRKIRRRRYRRTCTCVDCPRTFTAAPAPN